MFLFTCIYEGHVDNHVYIVPTMLTELLYAFQYGDTALNLAAMGGHTTCVEYLLSTPGIDVKIRTGVSWSA